MRPNYNSYSFIIETLNDSPELRNLFFQDDITSKMAGLELHNNIMYLTIILFAVTWIMILIIMNLNIKNKFYMKPNFSKFNHTSINMSFILFFLTSELLIGLLNVGGLGEITRILIYTNSDFLTTILPQYDYTAICNNTSFSHYTSTVDLLNSLSFFISNIIQSLENIPITDIPESQLPSAYHLLNDITINLHVVEAGILRWIEDLHIHTDEIQQSEWQHIADLFNSYNNYMRLAERLSTIVQARHDAIMNIYPNINFDQMVGANATIDNAGHAFNPAYIIVASRVFLYLLVAIYYNTDLGNSPMSI